MSEIFLGVMELQEAKNHQLALKNVGVFLELKRHHETCTSGCKVTVEVWGLESDEEKIRSHFQQDYLKHVKGHEPDFGALSAVFDPTAVEVTCQACGATFSPTKTECPDCGLCY